MRSGPDAGVLRVEEGGLGDSGGDRPAAKLDDQIVAGPGVGGVYICHSQHPADGVPHGARGNTPNLPFAWHELVLVLARLGPGFHYLPESGHVGDAVDPGASGGGDLALQGQADPALLQAVFPDPQQGVAAYEVTLLKPYPPTEAHVEGGVFLAYVGAVERKTLLDAQGLHGLQAVGLQVEPLRCLQDVLPQHGSLIRRRVQLVAQLAGVARARDEQLCVPDPARREPEEPQLVEVHAFDHTLEVGARTRSLYHGQGDGRGQVGHVGARAYGVLGDPTESLLARPGTGDDHEVLVVELVDRDVVYDAALLIAHRRVPELPRLHVLNFVHQQAPHQPLGARSLDVHLPHGRKVLHPYVPAHVQVLL